MADVEFPTRVKARMHSILAEIDSKSLILHQMLILTY